MNPVVFESGFEVDKGRNEGFLCHRCSWSGRSISTRLMSLLELKKHAATEHRIPPQSIDEFVSKAPHETRGESKGNFFGEPAAGNEPHYTKQRGKLQDVFPDAIMASQPYPQPVTTFHGPGFTPVIRNPLQILGQEPMAREFSIVDYSRHLRNFTNQPTITGSQGHSILTPSSANSQIWISPTSQIQSTTSKTTDIETKPGTQISAKGHPSNKRLHSRSSTYYGTMSGNLRAEDGAEDNFAAVREGACRSPGLIGNSIFSAIASAVDQGDYCASSNRDRDSKRHGYSNATSRPNKGANDSKCTASFSPPPRFHQNLPDYRTASLRLNTQSENPQLTLQELTYQHMTQPPGPSHADVRQSLQNNDVVSPSLDIQTAIISVVFPKSKSAYQFRRSPSDDTQFNQSRSQQLPEIVNNPHVIDLPYRHNPDRTLSSLPSATYFAMDEPSNVLGSPFQVTRTTSDQHYKKKRKVSEDLISRPASRRQIERPVPRSDKSSELDTVFCFADDVPHRTDIQYRRWLTDYAPDVPHHDLTYESFKAKFDRSKDKRTYMHLASERFLKERRTKLNEYEHITMDIDFLIGNLAQIEQINYVNAHRSELVSLMAQRAFQEFSAEGKLDDDQDIENARTRLEKNRGDISSGPGINHSVAPHREAFDSKTIPGRHQVMLPNGKLFDHTAEGAMPDNWEDAAKLLLGDDGSDGAESLKQDVGLKPNSDLHSGYVLPQEDQFFDFEAASAPWSFPLGLGDHEEGFDQFGL